MEEVALAGSKKNAAKEGRIIVFVDESGLTEKPHRVRTWAPKGSREVILFLEHLLRHIGGRLLVVWDRLNAHRSYMLADYLAASHP